MTPEDALVRAIFEASLRHPLATATGGLDVEETRLFAKSVLQDLEASGYIVQRR